MMREIAKTVERESLEKQINILTDICEKTSEERVTMIDKYISELSAELDALNRAKPSQKGGEYDIGWFSDKIFAEDSEVLLRKPVEEDRNCFIEVKRQNVYFPANFSREENQNRLWEDHINGEGVAYSIIRKDDGAYIGYCGIDELERSPWELEIELLEEYCHMGYGYKCLKMFMDRVAELSGRNSFVCRIDPDNTASQRLVEKIGFKPDGLADFVLYDDKSKRRFEEKYAEKIDDDYKAIAEKFGVEPVKLISHFLKFRI